MNLTLRDSPILRQCTGAHNQSRSFEAWDPVEANVLSLEEKMPLSSCSKNRELLNVVVRKLDQLANLSNEQKAARESGDPGRAMDLDRELDLVFGEKERSVGAWQEHTREHGC